MKPELLDEAVQSLRAAGESGAGRGAPGFDAIVKDVRRSARRRRLIHVAGSPLLVLLFGFGAWAAGSGRLVRLVETFTRDAEAPTGSERARTTNRNVPGALAANVESAAPGTGSPRKTEAPAAEPTEEPLVAEPSETKPALPPRARPARLSVPMAETAEATEAPSAETLYRKAHEAHFVHKQWPEAVAAWDAYLASRDLRFAIEARFNRALALVRLQRNDEAIEALQPFARGEYGGYRQQEAERILGWLASPPR